MESGTFPQRFRGGKLIVSPLQHPEYKATGMLGETSLGLEELRGRKHYSSFSHSEEKPWKSSVKTVGRSPPPLARTGGIRIPSTIITEARPRPEMRHIQFKPVTVEPREFLSKQVLDFTGQRVQDVETLEYDFHKTLIGRKRQVSDIHRKRNQIPCCSLGDKPYRMVERSDLFFKTGGLIAGSTNIARMPHQGKLNDNDFATVQSYEATSPRRIKWTDRVKSEAFSADSGDVSDLRKWEKTILKEANPKLVDLDSSDDEK